MLVVLVKYLNDNLRLFPNTSIAINGQERLKVSHRKECKTLMYEQLSSNLYRKLGKVNGKTNDNIHTHDILRL